MEPETTGQLKSITWEAPEHHHTEKTGEWYTALGIICLAGAAAAFMVGNGLFGILILLIGITVTITSLRAPEVITFSVSSRGIRVDERLYPFTSLESYYIDEEDPKGPQLLLKGERLMMPLIVIPLPADEVDEIEDIIRDRLPEERLEEPFFSKLLEFFGF